jgi:hypothetical protein
LQADLAIINSGTIRADRILGPGPFTMRNMLAMLPLDDAIMLLGACLARGSMLSCPCCLQYTANR